MTGQKLRGFVGQGMSGVRRSRTPVSRSYPPGTYTYTAAASGWFRFVLWGAGAPGVNGSWGGPSGAFVLVERPLAYGQSVSVTVGRGGVVGANGADTTITLPSGEVITAGGGTRATPLGGVATIGVQLPQDIALNGSLGGVAGGAGNPGASGLGTDPGTGGAAASNLSGGAGAPGSSGYRGGNGSTGASTASGVSPGGGGAENSGSGTSGGDGLLIVQQVRMKP